jgi:hypothetical protein
VGRGKGNPSELPQGRDEMRRAAFQLAVSLRSVESVLERPRWQQYVYASTLRDLKDAHERLGKVLRKIEPEELIG